MSETIFVFGSNLAGRHGAGAAKYARQFHGAEYGNGIGRQGYSYAIPTKDKNLETLPLETIKEYVDEFLDYARSNSGLRFYVTAVGCGLAGYTHRQIGPMFASAPPNCTLAEDFLHYREVEYVGLPNDC